MRHIAHFHPDYKLLDNLVLDESTLEACTLLSFEQDKSVGNFFAHPAHVDAITQLGGFALNAKDSTDLDNEVYVNHGWNSFQIYEEFKFGKTYAAYVQFQADNVGNLAHGDTIMLDGDIVVAFFKGLSVSHKIFRSC